MGTMNVFAALFGIFRQRGLVSTIKEGGSLLGFALFGVSFSILGGVLYGFAMGIGLGMDTAVKDAIKVGLIVCLGLSFSIPLFLVAYRLNGRQERFAQVAAVPLALVTTVAIVLAATAPVVFLLSVLAAFSQDAVYIHVVIVDVALLVGLYVSGVLVGRSFPERNRLLVPNAVGYAMLGVILIVLVNFFSPFLAPSPTFSVGTDRLMDGLGLGVAEKVDQALAAAASATRVRYRFQATDGNGDLTRDYTVTRVGNDYLLEVRLHAVPGEALRSQGHIWALDGQLYTDFDGGRVAQASYADLAGTLDLALPPAAFRLSPDFAGARWRAFEEEGRYVATGISQTSAQASVLLEAPTGRLSGLTLQGVEGGPRAETRLTDIVPAELDRPALEATLHQAMVLGSVDRSDAAMQDYVQDEFTFVVRYPRNWRATAWDPALRRVDFNSLCAQGDGCPALAVEVYDLDEGKNLRGYAEDLGASLRLQPEYREVKVGTTTSGDLRVGVVEYLFDRPVRGQIETARHREYIFEGLRYRYHLDFSAPETRFEAYRELFEEMAALFTFLKPDHGA